MSSCKSVFSQDDDAIPGQRMAQDMETLSEQQESEQEDEYIPQQLAHYRNHPLDINADRARLTEFPLMDALHLDNLEYYRSLMGDLINLYELQAVPGFTTDYIRSVIPFLCIGDRSLSARSLLERLKGGEQSMIIRPGLVPEKSLGFLSAAGSPPEYSGPRYKMLLRYTYRYQDLLQYGMLADQDAGEKFLFTKRQYGFDFFSFHVFARKLGVIRSLAIGDYQVNLGQGLFQWQSLAFNKSTEIVHIKRQSEVLRPYHSAGESNFFRGAGMTIGFKNMEATWFGSFRNLSANRDQDSSGLAVITSVQTSGLHRTTSEQEDRNAVDLISIGGNVRWLFSSGHVALNAIDHHYSLPLQRRANLYNFYSIEGNHWANASLDFAFTVHNYHVFGEAAMDINRHNAALIGLMSTLSPRVDLALLFRMIEPGYQSLYGNAFTENTSPTNERGLFAGSTIAFSPAVRVDLYADVFRFPWLRYRADAPGFGSAFLFQINWQPDKRVQVYSRFRARMKPQNETDRIRAEPWVPDKLLRSWRSHIGFHLNKRWLLRSRVEFCWFGLTKEEFPETGFLYYTDLEYTYSFSLTVTARLQVFETASYDTRLYAYENDVLFASSTPGYFGKGFRTYLNLKWKKPLLRSGKLVVNAGIKLGTIIYGAETTIGSGPDEIPGRHKSDIRLQFFLDHI